MKIHGKISEANGGCNVTYSEPRFGRYVALLSRLKTAAMLASLAASMMATPIALEAFFDVIPCG
jgi:hypothetical protein